MKSVVIACLGITVLAVIGCSGTPTSPAATLSGAGASLSASPRSGALHVLKDCTNGGEDPYTGQAGDHCTISSSNIKAIEVGSKVFYTQAAGATSLSSDIVLDVPGPGNNKAFGHCELNLLTGLGLCTFSGGTGKFAGFSGTANATQPTDGVNWHWDGTYSFDPRD